MPGYLEDVERALQFRCPALLHEWLPGGRQQGQYYTCANLQGGQGDSLKVYLSGPRAGKWRDYAGGEGDYGGNLVSLYAAIKGIEWKDALHALAEQLGIHPPPRAKSAIWKPIIPVPEKAYEVNEECLPALPKVHATEGAFRHWCYFNPDFELMWFQVQWNKTDKTTQVKSLLWRRESVTGEEAWRIGSPPEPRALYNLHDSSKLKDSPPGKILIVENETCVDAAKVLLPDWWVTTWSGGVGATAKSDWSGVRLWPARKVLWPSNSKSGLRAMADVGEILRIQHEIVRIDPSWSEGCDLSNLKTMGWDTAKVEAYLEANVIPIEPEPPLVRPEVDLTGKDHFRQMSDIFKAMREISADVYYYSSGVVYLRRNLHGLLEVSTMDGKAFRSWAAKRLASFHYNGNGKGPCPISEDLGNHVIFNSQGEISPLKRFSDVPIFTPGGRLLEKSGYHAESQVYVSIPQGYDGELPVEEAWGLVDDLLADFPFDTESDKTAALAFVLTAICRDLIAGPVPLFRFEAPAPGTGKSLLCEALCEIISPFPQEFDLSDDSEEIRKLITSALLTSPAVIRFDNVKKLDSAPLMRALTAHTWGDRILGESREIKVPVRNLWAATLNNPDLTPEIFRRTVRVRLNAKMPNPDTRPESTFRHHPLIGYVRKNRGILVSAFVSIARNGLGKSAKVIPAMGSYEEWVSTLAPILEANMFDGFLANREEDRDATSGFANEGLEMLVTKWKEEIGNFPVSVERLLEIARTIPALPGFRGKEISSRELGYMLRSHRDRIVCGATIRRAPKSGSSHRWALEGKFESSVSQNQNLPYSDPPEDVNHF